MCVCLFGEIMHVSLLLAIFVSLSIACSEEGESCVIHRECCTLCEPHLVANSTVDEVATAKYSQGCVNAVCTCRHFHRKTCETVHDCVGGLHAICPDWVVNPLDQALKCVRKVPTALDNVEAKKGLCACVLGY